MDWQLAIERNGEALKRILAMLVAMAGIGSRTHLPRSLHRACLRLLRPAESAARRLVIVVARGMTVTLPPIRTRTPVRTRHSAFIRNGAGTGIAIPPGYRIEGRRLVRLPARPQPARLSLPLFDTLSRVAAPRRAAVSGTPRISGFVGGYGIPVAATRRSGAAAPPGPDDPIASARLTLRIDALGRALNDLPGAARRFARWRARRDAAAQERNWARAEAEAANQHRRFRRIAPLRPGRPPGAPRRPTHEVHEVLADLNFFAHRALEPADTS